MENLTVAGVIEQTLTNGEGMRTVVFFQGCSHDCKGCHNHNIQEFTKESDYSINEVLNDIEDNSNYLDGVTLSGGEPFQQDLNDLLEFIMAIKDRTNLNIWIYTGYTIEQLLDFKIFRDQDLMEELLEEIEVLVDGKYKINMKDEEPKSYRGSTNQRILRKDKIRDIINSKGESENEWVRKSRHK